MTPPRPIDMKTVNAAVKIKGALRFYPKGLPSARQTKLKLDLVRLVGSMTTEEYTEYLKRIA